MKLGSIKNVDSLHFCVIIPSYLCRFKPGLLIKRFFSPIARAFRVINSLKCINKHKTLMLEETTQLSCLAAKTLGSYFICPFVRVV